VEDCEGKSDQNPVFHTETGFFIGVWNMTENVTLKIAVAISLAIHLLFLGIVPSLFQESKILRLPVRTVKVTLLPSVAKEKANAKMTLPVPLRVGNQDRDASPFDRKGLHQAVLPPPPLVTHILSFEEVRGFSKNKTEEVISNEPINAATAPGSLSGADPTLRDDGDQVSSKETTSDGEILPVALPSSHSEEEGGTVFSYGGSGAGSGSGIGPVGPGNGNSSKGSSGKGAGSLSRFFYAHRGGNGDRPRYADNPKPVYPKEARDKGYEGEVVLRVEVLINGRVGQIEIKKSSGYELLDHSALTAVKQWTFIPAKRGEVAIPLWVNIPVKFQLQ
jgi:TonB family protein